jgi:hypothetical protein
MERPVPLLDKPTGRILVSMSETHDPQEPLEDLEVTDESAEDVKGGFVAHPDDKPLGKGPAPKQIFDDPFFFDAN